MSGQDFWTFILALIIGLILGFGLLAFTFWSKFYA